MITPYLVFDGNCREAVTFYQRCIGGELHAMTFREAGHDAPPGAEERIIHARLTRGPVVLMASDTMPGMPYQHGGHVHLSLECESDDDVDRLFGELSEGGERTMPPHDAFWGARFAMLTDRFGTHWMLNHQRAQQG